MSDKDKKNRDEEPTDEKIDSGKDQWSEGFQTDVSNYFANARVCVLPSSKQEGSPTTVLEAMSYGVPIVAYNIDGLPELVRHEQDGLLVTVADKKQFTNSIIKTVFSLIADIIGSIISESSSILNGILTTTVLAPDLFVTKSIAFLHAW